MTISTSFYWKGTRLDFWMFDRKAGGQICRWLFLEGKGTDLFLAVYSGRIRPKWMPVLPEIIIKAGDSIA
ncbi:hypothetical protein KA005_36440 [bacterium]|nr:hypothetical protein [bacterium]